MKIHIKHNGTEEELLEIFDTESLIKALKKRIPDCRGCAYYGTNGQLYPCNSCLADLPRTLHNHFKKDK